MSGSDGRTPEEKLLDAIFPKLEVVDLASQPLVEPIAAADPTPTEIAEKRIKTARVVENERWKYAATMLNTVAAATATLGLVSPAAIWFWKPTEEHVSIGWPTLVGGILFWGSSAVALHCLATLCLGKLKA